MFQFLTAKLGQAVNYFSSSKQIDDSQITNYCKDLELSLLDADVPVSVCRKLVDQIKVALLALKPSKTVKLQDQVMATIFKQLLTIMQTEQGGEEVFAQLLNKGGIVLVAGLQGAGKTTTLSKIAHFLQQEALVKSKELRILATSLDFQRPAAIQQLAILAQQTGFDFLQPEVGDVYTTIEQAKHKFSQETYNLLLIDTPGRLHLDNQLMQQLQEIDSELQPTHKILVIDSMTGQESLKITQAFEQTLNLTGAILTKADSDSKGGLALSFYAEIKKPVLFLGTGEHAQDLEKFVPQRIASRLLGQGDLSTLFEKLEKKLTAERMEDPNGAMDRLLQGQFDFNDFATQMQTVLSMGSLQKVLSYLPGVKQLSQEQMAQGERDIRISLSLIGSMTKKERLHPELLRKQPSRKERVARGAGRNMQDLERLLNKFEETKQFAKLLKGKGFKDMFTGQGR